jgi:hypothetical protein
MTASLLVEHGNSLENLEIARYDTRKPDVVHLPERLVTAGIYELRM